MMVDCAERYDYEDLYFMVDGLWVQLNAEDYIYELGDECVLGIMAADIEFWVMGSAWLQGYYTHFDNSDKANPRIGIAPNDNSDKDEIT